MKGLEGLAEDNNSFQFLEQNVFSEPSINRTYTHKYQPQDIKKIDN